MEEDFLALIIAATNVDPQAIGWMTAPQGVGYPKVVLNIINDVDGLAHDGPVNLFEGITQVDVYSLDRAETKTIARQIRTALHGYKGGGFGVIQHERTRDSREGGSNEAERPFRVSMDFFSMWSA